MRIIGLFLSVALAVSHAQSSLLLLETPLLTADQTGNATAALTVRNTDPKNAVPLRLSLSDFQRPGPDGEKHDLGTTSTLAPLTEKDKPFLEGSTPLPVNGAASFKLTVTRLLEAGQSEAVLKNDGQDIPTRSDHKRSILKALTIPAAPYNIQVVSATLDSPEIHFAGAPLYWCGPKAPIGLKNSDPYHYLVTWKLNVRGELLSAGQKYLHLPANSTTYIDLSSRAPWAYWLTAGTLKDEVIKGDLILEPVIGTAAVHQPLPPRVLPVTFRLSYWSPFWQQLFNVVFLFLLLAAGGVASIWVHYGMPNTTDGLALRKRLRGLEAQVRGLDPAVESRWRALLESRAKSLLRELDTTWWIFPSFRTTLGKLAEDAGKFQECVTVAYEVSLVLQQVPRANQALPGGIPPTIHRWIERKCASALRPMETDFTTPEEIERMKSDLKAAQDYLNLTLTGAPIPDLDKEIQQRESRLKPLLAPLLLAYPSFAGLLNQVSTSVTAGTPPIPADYVVRDTSSLKAHLLGELLQLQNQAPVAVAATAGGGSQPAASSASTRLATHTPRLLSFLGSNTYDSLRLAQLFLDEMRQDIYAAGVLEDELRKQPPALTIRIEPAKVMAGQSVQMALRFNRDILNEAVARQEWKCTWDFSDGPATEAGWEVHHGFSKAGDFPLKVSITGVDGTPLTSTPLTRGLSVIAEAGAQKKGVARAWMEPETKLEASRLALVLALAVVGLMATARQQAQSLSFLEAVGAVIALGFAADTLKNLVTQRPSGS